MENYDVLILDLAITNIYVTKISLANMHMIIFFWQTQLLEKKEQMSYGGPWIHVFARQATWVTLIQDKKAIHV